MTRALNERVQDFRSRTLTGRYPVISTDALYEKVRVDGRGVSTAVLVACGVNAEGNSGEKENRQNRCRYHCGCNLYGLY